MSSDTLDSASKHSQFKKASNQLASLSELQREYDEIIQLQQDPRMISEYMQSSEPQIDRTSIYLNIGDENITYLQEEKVPQLFQLFPRITMRNNIAYEFGGQKFYICQYCSKEFSKPCQLGGHSQKKHRLERMNNIKQKPK
ncbi:hypothetical protein pb186bvf_002033 [Paramecium bursaria]